MARAKVTQKPAESSPTAPRADIPVHVKDSKDVGGVIHALRKGRKVTLAEAAGLSGVGIRFLLELEHGKTTASLGKTLQVLRRLGLDLWVVPKGRRVDIRE